METIIRLWLPIFALTKVDFSAVSDELCLSFVDLLSALFSCNLVMYLYPNKRVHSWESLTISEFITKKNVQLIFFVVKLPKTPWFLPSNVVGAFRGFFLYVLGVPYVEEELTHYIVLHVQEVLTHFISCYIKWANNI